MSFIHLVNVYSSGNSALSLWSKTSTTNADTKAPGMLGSGIYFFHGGTDNFFHGGTDKGTYRSSPRRLKMMTPFFVTYWHMDKHLSIFVTICRIKMQNSLHYTNVKYAALSFYVYFWCCNIIENFCRIYISEKQFS